MIINDCVSSTGFIFSSSIMDICDRPSKHAEVERFYSISIALRYNSPANVRVIGITNRKPADPRVTHDRTKSRDPNRQGYCVARATLKNNGSIHLKLDLSFTMFRL